MRLRGPGLGRMGAVPGSSVVRSNPRQRHPADARLLGRPGRHAKRYGDLAPVARRWPTASRHDPPGPQSGCPRITARRCAAETSGCSRSASARGPHACIGGIRTDDLAAEVDRLERLGVITARWPAAAVQAGSSPRRSLNRVAAPATATPLSRASGTGGGRRDHLGRRPSRGGSYCRPGVITSCASARACRSVACPATLRASSCTSRKPCFPRLHGRGLIVGAQGMNARKFAVQASGRRGR